MAQKHSSRSRRQKKTTLYLRISISLLGPLLILSLIFSMVQLANEMRNLNNNYQIKSLFVFDTVQKTLSVLVKNWNDLDTLKNLKTMSDRLNEAYPEVEIHLYDIMNRELFYGTQQSPWADFDKKALEASLYQKQKGKPYLARIDRDTQKLAAYIPLDNPEGIPIVMARVRFPLASMAQAMSNSRGVLISIVLFITLTGLAIGYRLSKSIVQPMQTLNTATQEIMQGHLDQHVDISTGDEIEELALTFNKMSDALKEMQKKAIDANPLTGLPGNQGIFQELKKRIHERQKFVLFHTDIDRFKVFNDHFGLAKGDEAIKKTSSLLAEVVKKAGSGDDFVGHQGGDDFVVISRPQHAEKIAQAIVHEFDNRILKELYTKEDFDRGFTLQIDRRRLAETGEEQLAKFPLIAISLAGVSNAKKDFADYFDCMSAAVSVKKEVKKVIQSSYAIKE